MIFLWKGANILYRHCTTEKTAAQQRLFERTLLEATHHQPYQDISVSQLCQLSGLSRKTFYRLFENKEDVLVALIDHTIMEYETFIGPSDSIGKNILNEPMNYFAYWRCHKQLLDILAKTNKTALLLERSVDHILREQREVRAHFGVDQEPYAEDALMFYVSGMMSLVIRWYQSDFARPESEMAELLNRLLYTPPVKHAKYISK